MMEADVPSLVFAWRLGTETECLILLFGITYIMRYGIINIAIKDAGRLNRALCICSIVSTRRRVGSAEQKYSY